MKRKIILILLFFTVILHAQFTGPDGNNYSNTCNHNGFGTIVSAQVWFNTPTTDCHSNDWIIEFIDVDGNILIMTDEDWAESSPDSDGYYDFGNDLWNCCSYGSINNGDTCPCTWEYDPETSFLLIICPDC
ncbi:MAG TPA: hypothetical protein ENJ95_21395 [Bacteroidetes bacterium]|nr:hypothetical protein [Bacteroidota bacterium]